MYNSGMAIWMIINAFGLKNHQQVSYRAKLLGLRTRQSEYKPVMNPKPVVKPKPMKEPKSHLGRPRNSTNFGLKPEDPGVPTRMQDQTNYASRKWFDSQKRCEAQPCKYLAVPTGLTCFEHGSTHASS